MLPLRLELHNFLPYRSPDPINFEGVHLACLTGPNGAGKSALLDAITWALWGRARGRREDDLVHLGQSEMSVQLDFEQEGVIYRVVRQRRSGKKGQGILNFFVMQPDGTPRLMNEPALRQTEEKIRAILRLDYETFIASAFLQQGKADAFTTKTPAERKKILSDILGLERWAHYEERAKTQINDLKTSIMADTASINEIDNELAKESQYQRERAAAQTAYDEAQVALATAEAHLQEVAHAHQELAAQRQQLAEHESRLRQYETERQAAQADLARHTAAIAQHEAILAQGDQIEAGYQALQQARQMDSTLGSKLRQQAQLDSFITELQKEIALARAALENALTEQQTRIAQADVLLQAVNATELPQAQAAITALEALDEEREGLHQQRVTLEKELATLETTRNSLHADGKKLNERIDRLAAAEGATCPLCGQPLTEQHRMQVVAEITQERDAMRQRYSDAKTRGQAVADQLKACEARMEALAQEIKGLPALRNRAGALQKQQADAELAQVHRAEAEAERQRLQQQIAAEDYAPAAYARLAEVQAERAALGYDEASHESAQQSLTTYQAYEQQHLALQIARSALPGEQAQRDNAQARLDRLAAASTDETARAAAARSQIAQLELLVAEQRRRQEEVARYKTQLTSASERLGAANQRLASLEQRRERKASLEIRIENSEKERAVYMELRDAFGKNGVPAMMIETAIPELEAEANELLARMTNGRMHLRLTTQREKVTGGLSETLDIEIADDLGTRSYDLYSGGEAFRVNFALRIALSKLLARRAGAHLRTLFIDEGFGTQDDDGRSKLVEAINLIQTDFDLILVITHIEELRDSFPVHLVIEKTPNGSFASLR